MLKTPRFLLTASLALALVFTFSCSGDDGDSPPATLPSSSDAGVSQLPSSPSVAPSSSSEDAALSSSSHDEELVEVSSSSEEESSSSAAPPPYIPPYNPPYIPPVVPSSSSSSVYVHVPCEGFTDGAYFHTPYGEKKHFCDKRDGNVYAYVEIGTETWMAENLNYVVEGSRCYDDHESNCEIYGRLYNWVTAYDLPQECNTTNCASQIKSPHQGICPEGWHIPPTFTPLQNAIKENNNNNQEGNILRANSDLWEPYAVNPDAIQPIPELRDKYGFSALPAGYYESNPSGVPGSPIEVIGGYVRLGSETYWWYAGQHASQITSGWVKRVHNIQASAPAQSGNKSNFYSVRCIKD